MVYDSYSLPLAGFREKSLVFVHVSRNYYKTTKEARNERGGGLTSTLFFNSASCLPFALGYIYSGGVSRFGLSGCQVRQTLVFFILHRKHEATNADSLSPSYLFAASKNCTKNRQRTQNATNCLFEIPCFAIVVLCVFCATKMRRKKLIANRGENLVCELEIGNWKCRIYDKSISVSISLTRLGENQTRKEISQT